MNEEIKVENIKIDKIIPNIYQPRIKFDDKSINELSKSIKEHGIIQPIIVRKIGEKYEIIDGERRYKAAKKIGRTTLPAIILEIEDKEMAELILTENMQKQLLTPIEEANAYQQIMLLNRFDVDELAVNIGKDKQTIENKLKLLTLPSEIQEALLNGKISEGHAKLLLKVKEREKQLSLFNKILEERITVKNLEEIISKDIKQTEKKENIMEVNKMDNTQLNFNQYNNLLKEQEKPQMNNASQPEAILGNTVVTPKPNDFFPSLEDQPLNMEVPVAQNTQEVPNMPQFEVPNISAPSQEIAPQPEVPQMVMPEAPSMAQMPQFEVPNLGVPSQEAAPQPEVPQMVIPEAPSMAKMPQFEVPNLGVPSQEIAPQPEVPQMVMPEAPSMAQMPQFEVPNINVPSQEVVPQPEVPQMVMPEAPSMAQMPQFEVPNLNAPSQEVAPQPEIPQMVMPEAPSMTQMPQFEVPNINAPSQEVAPQLEVPQQNNTIVTDVMPAVNMIRNLIPLLENSGYKINIEESDNPNEYQVIIKVQK